MTARVVLMVLVTGSACSAAISHAQPPDPVLAGPKVSAASSAPSLVERDESGKIRRLDIPPAEAAVRHLALDEKTEASVREILDRRAAALDRVVRENLTLLVKLANASQAGDRDESRRLLRELYTESGSLRAPGRLQDELAGVLTPEQAAEMKRMVDEYTGAIYAEAQAALEGEGAGMDDAGQGTVARGERSRALRRAAQAEMLGAVGRELKRSYDRVVTAAVRDFDELLARLQLRPEQEAEIRRLATDQFQKTEGNPTPAQRGELFLSIYRSLDASQRAKLLEEVRGKNER